MSERLILALDGSTRVCSTALLRTADNSEAEHSEVVARRAENDGRGQARVLLRQVDEMFHEIGAEPSDLTEVVVGLGPGTFTGVRIAVATARGLALALSVPVFGASTLTALARCAVVCADESELPAWSSVIPVVDARREQVFFGVCERAGQSGTTDGAEQWTCSREIGVCDRGGLGDALGKDLAMPALIVGEDQGLVTRMPEGVTFLERSVDAAYLVLGTGLLPGDLGAGERGAARGEEDGCGREGAPEMVRPIYVRAPDADVHITKMKDPWADGKARR